MPWRPEELPVRERAGGGEVRVEEGAGRGIPELLEGHDVRAAAGRDPLEEEIDAVGEAAGHGGGGAENTVEDVQVGDRQVGLVAGGGRAGAAGDEAPLDVAPDVAAEGPAVARAAHAQLDRDRDALRVCPEVARPGGAARAHHEEPRAEEEAPHALRARRGGAVAPAALRAVVAERLPLAGVERDLGPALPRRCAAGDDEGRTRSRVREGRRERRVAVDDARGAPAPGAQRQLAPREWHIGREREARHQEDEGDGQRRRVPHASVLTLAAMMKSFSCSPLILWV
jgi:hypothetical protein